MQDDSEPGWRERKRRETAQRIAEVGLRLFIEQGYDATTLEAIAEESGIARRTFFHYFESKEDIILAWQNGLPEQFRAALLAQSTRDGPVEAVRRAHLSLVAHYDANRARFIDRIIRSRDRLRAANQAKYLLFEQVGFETLCELWPDPARRAGLRVVAVASVAAFRLAIDAWVAEDDRRPLSEHITTTFDTLRAEFSG